jgi:tetratricopeptide (TPR) repeat protein
MLTGDMPTRSELSKSSAPLQFPDRGDLSLQARESFQEGVALIQAGEAKSAIVALSRCIEHGPDFTEAHIYLGVAHAMTCGVYPAMDHLERATELEPDSFMAHFMVAQLNFKLRIPQKGYAAAERALKCARAPQERRMLAQLLKEEHAREHNGIARPWFNKPFSFKSLVVLGGGLAAAVVALIGHLMLSHVR